jgi:hypothetical protein
MQGGRAMVRGTSLQCDDTSVPVATVRPADEVTATVPLLTRIALDDIVFNEIYDVKRETGILHMIIFTNTSAPVRGGAYNIVPRFLSKTRSGNGPGSKERMFFGATCSVVELIFQD